MIKLEPNNKLLRVAAFLDTIIGAYQPPGRLVGEPCDNPKINEADLIATMKKGDVVVAPNVYAYYIESKSDAELRTVAQQLFPATPIISVSGKFHYPASGGYMGWHTNSNAIGHRVYATKVDEDNKSFFRYYDKGKVITEWEKKGWNFRTFKVSKEKLYWHCVYTEIDRYSFGFRFSL